MPLTQALMPRYTNPPRRLLVPEVVQTSYMDCGPAALKSLLEGFGIPVSYGRLREACQTGVDGTSIDTLEQVANQLGFDAAQVMIPADHLLLPTAQSLPALCVVRLPNGLTHFVVVWGTLHGRVQVMDPASGRRWVSPQRLHDELYIHTHAVPADLWREWAGTDGFLAPLRERIRQLAATPNAEPQTAALLDQATSDPSWRGLATLDAATRMVAAVVDAGGLQRGSTAIELLAGIVEQTLTGGEPVIPPPYWTALPDMQQPELLQIRGALLVQIYGRRAAAPDISAAPDEPEPEPLTPELIAALQEPPTRPLREIWALLRQDGLLTPLVLLPTILLAGLVVLIQAVLLRGLLDLGRMLAPTEQRLQIVVAAIIFIGLMFVLDYAIHSTVLRLGRNLEIRLRVRFLEKVPRLGDRYFQSRLMSDMAERLHSLRQIRSLPHLAIDFLRTTFQLIFTAVGLIILHPASAPLALAATLFAIVLVIVSQPLLIEYDLRQRTHQGGLMRFYLDTLLGLVPIRTHRAQPALRRQHESLLVEWVRSSNEFFRAHLLVRSLDLVIGVGFTIWILLTYISSGGTAGGALLYFYWALALPTLGRAMAAIAQQYPMQRNQILRLLEPISAPEDDTATNTAPASLPPTTPAAIQYKNVHIQASGHTILQHINLTIAPAEHIAIVGASGAGKSSLVGVLLGWHRPASGQVLLDGQPLTGDALYQMRRTTVWIDPTVQIWNRTLHENIRYGNDPAALRANKRGEDEQREDERGEGKQREGEPVPIEQADLLGVLRGLPQGMQTPLGEGGGLVSGGEGQRVRLGRGMQRDGVRLVILDEPFRGLDRAQRHKLLQRARAYWRGTTLIYISHDIDESLAFERVLVVDAGQVVEDGNPAALAANPQSRYARMVQADQAVHTHLWTEAYWQRLWLANGSLHPPTPAPGDSDAT